MSCELPLNLPPVEPAARAEPRAKAAPAPPLVAEADWSIVDHVCGECFARLVGRIKDGERFYRCTGCGWSSADGKNPLAKTSGPGGRWTPAICACHLKFGRRDAGIRCVVNDKRSMASPTEIVARQVAT